jgi:cephalosporin hydroxylase
MSDRVHADGNALQDFYAERVTDVSRMAADPEMTALANRFMIASSPYKYSYHFDWLGRPIIQFPQDIVAFQEVVWSVKPDLIIETGVAHGGSLVLSASLLALLDMSDAIANNTVLDPKVSSRRVVGIDIDIRSHNRALIESHPMASRIELIQGSSIDSALVARVHELAKGYRKVLVCLDSNHTHAHVLAELEAYAPLVTIGSYCIVWDTIVEDVPKSLFPDRPWGPGDNPKTAVREYLKGHPEFEIDKTIDNKLLFSVAPDGYLKRLP